MRKRKTRLGHHDELQSCLMWTLILLFVHHHHYENDIFVETVTYLMVSIVHQYFC